VLFFVRDPSDQSFSPVKDIMERSGLAHLRKVGLIGVKLT
jgi:E3 ubiquitin-protein ligase DOA10